MTAATGTPRGRRRRRAHRDPARAHRRHAPTERRVPDPRGGYRDCVARVRDPVRQRGQLPEHPRGQLIPRPDRGRHDVRHHRRWHRSLGRLAAGAVRGTRGIRLTVRERRGRRVAPDRVWGHRAVQRAAHRPSPDGRVHRDACRPVVRARPRVRRVRRGQHDLSPRQPARHHLAGPGLDRRGSGSRSSSPRSRSSSAGWSSRDRATAWP